VIVAESPEAAEARKHVARLERRLARLELTMSQVETMRDTNARLLDRLMRELDEERARSHRLLLNVLPQPIIDRLNAGESTIADRHDDVTVLFSDLVGFTNISGRLPITRVVGDLTAMFSAFDDHAENLGVEKIKTIGDAYMAAAGIPGTSEDATDAVAALALIMVETVRAIGEPWHIRIGIHRGPVVAGVIGRRKFVYDLWGDTVNVASRLETSAEPDTIQVSQAVVACLGPAYRVEPRGDVELKGKGPTASYALMGRSAAG
jgi:adenylate cyclase